jgi:hypothetical protein
MFIIIIIIIIIIICNLQGGNRDSLKMLMFLPWVVTRHTPEDRTLCSHSRNSPKSNMILIDLFLTDGSVWVAVEHRYGLTGCDM